MTSQSIREDPEWYRLPSQLATAWARGLWTGSAAICTLDPVLLMALHSGDVLLIVALVAAPLSLIAFLGAGSVYREIGKGDFAMDRESDLSRPPTPAVARAEQEAEIRQMLEAKAFRQRERGETPIDVDAELQRMRAPAVSVSDDPTLVEEVRQLVVARNHRRLRSRRGAARRRGRDRAAAAAARRPRSVTVARLI